MGPVGVVLDPPGLDHDLGHGEAGELLDVEQLVTYAAVEGLDVGVLPRRAGLDVPGLGAGQAAPLPQGPRDQLRAVEFLMVVKACSWVRAGRWDGRHRGALGDSLLDALVPPAVAAASVADDATGGTNLGWDLVALGHDCSALGGGDRAAIDIAHLVGGAVTQTGNDPGAQHGGDGAQRPGVWWRPVWHLSRW